MSPATRRRPVRPPITPSPPAMPRGPRLYQPEKGGTKRNNVFVDVPDDWPGTDPEWRVYAASFKALNIPGDPRDYPSAPAYRGIEGVFAYQDPFEGGRIGGAGGQVFDFVYYSTPRGVAMVIRVQGSYWHTERSNKQQVTDAYLMTRASRFYEVQDIYDYEVMADDTGEAAVMTLKERLAGNTSENPMTANVARKMT
jgi:hypothetical protein